MVEPVGAGQVASPYAAGGGGTVLEHRFGAVLLAHLLLGDAVPALGDDVRPVSVRFQDSAFSPVDDVIVVGETADGAHRRLSVGVRRAPKFTTSDESTADLLVSYLRVVTDHWDEVRVGGWRLALAVASPNPALQQVRELAVIAHGQPDEESFRAAVAQAGRTNEAVRSRLTHLDALVAQAATSKNLSTEPSAQELTWRMLHVLWLLELRLEGVDESDRTSTVGRLRSIVPDSTVAAADALFGALERLSERYAPVAASVTESMLRRHLSPTAINRSPSYATAWRVLDALSETASALVRFRLTGAEVDLELERVSAAEALAAAMNTAATQASALVVTGEPDAGKSALVVRTARRLNADGVAIMALHLREMPAALVELEALLGTRLATVLGASAVGHGRLLVIDGAESVLEGRSRLLSDLVRTAITAGLGVVAVTRTDGSGAVRDVLNHATQTIEREHEPLQCVVRDHEISRLTSAEIDQLVEAFPHLRRWARDERAAWLLGRPGLVDMLLRAGPDVAAPEGAVSEADLFAAVWRHLVRRGEVRPPGAPSPDARDLTLQALARRELLPHDNTMSPDPMALPSLRSDGLLASYGATNTWSASDRFASDLVRDMALVRVFVADGFAHLAAAGAPRWALRAARVACQARLLDTTTDVRRTFRSLRTTFDQIAHNHGERWSDVPWEAVLTLGAVRQTLSRIWPDLQADQHAGLRTVLRLAMQRYATHDVGDPVVLGPLVELTFCHERNPDDVTGAYNDADRSVRDLVLAWLRGLASMDTSAPLPLRQLVRDRILATEPAHWDVFAVEAMAMLGPDLDQRVEAFLTGIVDDGGARLDPVVERFWPTTMMVKHQPDLLLTLSESYYIERYDTPHSRFDWPGYPFADGIRRHRSPATERMVGWHHGPFWQLLMARLVPALAMINRMLDHAASIRVGDPNHLTQTPIAELPGADLDLPGIGVRHCVGDEHVWAWYRGSTVGPYPCMSALLAVERLADQLIALAGVPFDQVVTLLLHDCSNLAMPGLVVGLLVRHLEQADQLLDPWMRHLEVWRLEFARVTGEGVLHVQGPDAPDLVGRTRRSSTFRDVAAELTIRAALADDRTRLDELAAVGTELIRRAEELAADSDGGEQVDRFLTSVRGWAATFNPANYHLETDQSGNVAVQYAHPEPLATRIRPEAEDFARGSEALRLQNTYAKSPNCVAPVETLLADITIARSLSDNPPDATINRLDPIAAVAAAAAVAHADQYLLVPVDDLRWATQILIQAITEPSRTEYVAASFYVAGADRSAAVGLPALLAAASDETALDRQAIIDVLERCATNHFHEVRLAFAQAIERVWSAPCDTNQHPDTCRHEAALDAVRAGLRDCQLGNWDPATGRRSRPCLEGPYEHTLPNVETERLYLISLIPPTVAAASALRSDSCVADQASTLADALLDAHARATAHWATEGFENRYSMHGARVLVDLANARNTRPLTAHLHRFASNARALRDLLHNLAVLFTYDDALRPSLLHVWRVAMQTSLDAIGDGTSLRTDHHWADDALGALLPTPTIDVSDGDIDTTLAHARRNWLHPDSIADLVTRWIPIARHEPRAVDAAAQLSKCAPLEWQRDTGLIWAEQLIDSAYHAIANRCWYLTDWLQTIHSRDDMLPDQTTRWRRLIDGLTAAGDYRAARLQQIEE